LVAAVDDAPFTEDVPPDPGAMIESMRAFGYSLPTAVADLVDNSITAGAISVWVDLHWEGGQSTVRVLDDGRGMAPAALTNAMRLGSRSPRELRAPDDLGRFGLGLKTASFSQARDLTVASRAQGGAIEARRWDLDFVTRTRSWSLLKGPDATTEHVLADLGPLEHGTLVRLERLDRLVGDVSVDDTAAHERFLEHVNRTEAHLAMVFHRFLSGTQALHLYINGRRVEPWDPFLIDHPAHAATQQLPPDSLPFEGGKVEVHPFVLPHQSKLGVELHRRAAGPRGWNAHQGFYVYRARRLLVAGDWLGLPFRQEEHNKLARISIDLDNAMDASWQIDVRKATARIPGPLRDRLKAMADTTRRRASDAYRFRGKIVAREQRAGQAGFVWQRRSDRDGQVTYVVNREHPLISASLDEGGAVREAVQRTLRLTEENLPLAAITIDASERPETVDAQQPFAGRDREVLDMLRRTHVALVSAGGEPLLALQTLASVEPFDTHPAAVAVVHEELENR
jgi:hypothetical protein